jgi:hypothetical protein
MISARLLGGLGNIMFQVAAIEALAKRQPQDVDVVFSSADHRAPVGNHANVGIYVDNFFGLINIIEEPIVGLGSYTEPRFEFNELPFIDNTVYNGHYQSEKYFLDCSDHIHTLFYPSAEDEEYILGKYSNINFSSATSLHVRRADYVKLSDIHPPCSLEYYESALSSLGVLGGDVLVFSDDIEWCKSNIGTMNYNFNYIENEFNYIDMYMMSFCKNNIIANSSFSWWGAWLNENVDKNVIAPINWFGDKAGHDISDLIPKEWSVL